MIDVALQFLSDELNNFILARTGSNSVEVKMSKVVDEAGKYAFVEESISASIINIEEERIFKSQVPDYKYINGQHVVLEPNLKLNLYVLLAANFKLYDVALKYISLVLIFFQSHPYFTPEVYPGLDSHIEKLIVEMQSLSYEQLNQIWTFIGGKQLPSIVYKVRMVVLQDQTQVAIRAAAHDHQDRPEQPMTINFRILFTVSSACLLWRGLPGFRFCDPRGYGRLAEERQTAGQGARRQTLRIV